MTVFLVMFVDDDFVLGILEEAVTLDVVVVVEIVSSEEGRQIKVVFVWGCRFRRGLFDSKEIWMIQTLRRVCIISIIEIFKFFWLRWWLSLRISFSFQTVW